ncbi:hypothetical protein [Streptomyces sp. LaBMicrA B280]|uniref:hypothetical protein n=1 Tax=Streptomyces sp. LaBMicrA B280 TaxID=3391001 RepID=UPI003BA821FF
MSGVVSLVFAVMVHFTVVLSLEHAALMFVFSQYGSRSSRRWFALKAAKPAIDPLLSLPEIEDRPQTSFHVGVWPSMLNRWTVLPCLLAKVCTQASPLLTGFRPPGSEGVPPLL